MNVCLDGNKIRYPTALRVIVLLLGYVRYQVVLLLSKSIETVYFINSMEMNTIQMVYYINNPVTFSCFTHVLVSSGCSQRMFMHSVTSESKLRQFAMRPST
jgi:hypothetical protein